jgi:GT2 family glycosyltransferase
METWRHRLSRWLMPKAGDSTFKSWLRRAARSPVFAVYFAKKYIQTARAARRLPWRPAELAGMSADLAQQMERALLLHAWNIRHRPPPLHFRRYEANNRLTEAERRVMAAMLPGFARKPLISICTPAYNTRREWAEELVDSVLAQVYPHWELVVVDDASPDPRVAPMFQRLARMDPRIKFLRRDRNGRIAQTTNDAAAAAKGEWLTFLDHDDLLEPEALWQVVRTMNERPDADVIYSDEYITDAEGLTNVAHFKPDYSPEMLLTFNYICHLTVMRTSLFRDLGGLRTEYDGAQDHDLMLRAAEKTDRWVHIPRPLYRWRAVGGSTAAVGGAKPQALDAGKRAVAGSLVRRGVPATADRPPQMAHSDKVMFHPSFQRKDWGKVSILIPTKNKDDYLRRCVESLLALTAYPNYEVVVIDNGSDEPATLDYLRELGRRPRCRVLRIENGPDGFNFSRINNAAAEQVDGKFLLLLNNDMEIISADWLDHLVGTLQVPGVGCVGARLLFGDRTIQHAGILVDVSGANADHPWAGAAPHDVGYFAYNVAVRNVSAVTGACLLTPRDLYAKLGGLEDKELRVGYSDVEYCIKVLEAGLRCVYVPQAELIHYESRSRGRVPDFFEVERISRRLAGRRDPYYNPNFIGYKPYYITDTRRQRRLLPSLAEVQGPGGGAEPHASNGHAGTHEPAAPTGPLRVLAVRSAASPATAKAGADVILAGLRRRKDLALTVIELPAALDSAARAAAAAKVREAVAESEAQAAVILGLHALAAVPAAADAGVPPVWMLPGVRRPFERDGGMDVEQWEAVGDALAKAYRVVFDYWWACWAFRMLDEAGNCEVLLPRLDPPDRPPLDDDALAAERARLRREMGLSDGDVLVVAADPADPEGLPGGAEVLHRAALKLLPSRPKLHVRILGRSAASLPVPAELAGRFKVEEGLSPAQVSDLLTACDAYVSQDHTDHYPRRTLEAMARQAALTVAEGTNGPVTGTSCGPSFPQNDDNRLAELLAEMIDRPARLAELRRQSRYCYKWLCAQPTPDAILAERLAEAAELSGHPPTGIPPALPVGIHAQGITGRTEPVSAPPAAAPMSAPEAKVVSVSPTLNCHAGEPAASAAGAVAATVA